MKLESQYKFGDIVYLRTDIEQNEYLITGIHFRLNSIEYSIANNGIEVTVYPFEITANRNRLKELGISES